MKTLVCILFEASDIQYSLKGNTFSDLQIENQGFRKQGAEDEL